VHDATVHVRVHVHEDIPDADHADPAVLEVRGNNTVLPEPAGYVAALIDRAQLVIGNDVAADVEG